MSDKLTPDQSRLAADNTRLVYRIAQRLSTSLPGEWDELVGDGMLGLCRAAQRFDPQRGYRFSTYAWPYIDGFIRHGARTRTQHRKRQNAGAPATDASLDRLAEDGYDPAEPSDPYAALDNRDAIDHALDALPAPQRQAAEAQMAGNGARTHLAETLGVTPQAVSHRWTQARARLATLLEAS